MYVCMYVCKLVSLRQVVSFTNLFIQIFPVNICDHFGQVTIIYRIVIKFVFFLQRIETK